MKKNENIVEVDKHLEIKYHKFEVGDDFIDPLLKNNINEFQEMEVEEIPAYYRIFLGLPGDEQIQ